MKNKNLRRRNYRRTVKKKGDENNENKQANNENKQIETYRGVNCAVVRSR